MSDATGEIFLVPLIQRTTYLVDVIDSEFTSNYSYSLEGGQMLVLLSRIFTNMPPCYISSHQLCPSPFIDLILCLGLFSYQISDEQNWWNVQSNVTRLLTVLQSSSYEDHWKLVIWLNLFSLEICQTMVTLSRFLKDSESVLQFQLANFRSRSVDDQIVYYFILVEPQTWRDYGLHFASLKYSRNLSSTYHRHGNKILGFYCSSLSQPLNAEVV